MLAPGLFPKMHFDYDQHVYFALIFSGKLGSNMSSSSIQLSELPPILVNIRLGWRCLPESNARTYYGKKFYNIGHRLVKP
jgi:hypothetical protein